MSERKPPVFSPVDYDAWSRGYIPPSEHVLIDALQFRGAKVQMSTGVGHGGQVWIVYSGPAFNAKARRHLLAMMQALDEALVDEEPPASAMEAEGRDAQQLGAKPSSAALVEGTLNPLPQDQHDRSGTGSEVKED